MTLKSELKGSDKWGWGGEGGCVILKSTLSLILFYMWEIKSHTQKVFFFLSVSLSLFFFFLLSGVRTLAGRDYIKDVEVGVAI